MRQEDNISRLLFNSAVDALVEILRHLILGVGVTHLQYADDTMITLEMLEMDTINLMFLSLCLEEMAGLRINFDKSEVAILGYSPLPIWGCQSATLGFSSRI
jgi:hypothetical protein